MTKKLFFGFLATSLTLAVLAQTASAQVLGLPEKHACAPAEIELLTRVAPLVQRDCSAESQKILKDIAWHLNTCDLGGLEPKAMMKIGMKAGKVNADAYAYLSTCALKKAAADFEAKQRQEEAARHEEGAAACPDCEIQ